MPQRSTKWPIVDFINRDPIQESGGVNLYAFVANNPVPGFDVLGLDGDDDSLPGFDITVSRCITTWLDSPRAWWKWQQIVKIPARAPSIFPQVARAVQPLHRLAGTVEARQMLHPILHRMARVARRTPQTNHLRKKVRCRLTGSIYSVEARRGARWWLILRRESKAYSMSSKLRLDSLR